MLSHPDNHLDLPIEIQEMLPSSLKDRELRHAEPLSE